MGPLVVNARVTVPESEIVWTAVRASGPGGQNVNKVSSKVELRFDLEHTETLGAQAKERLRQIAGRRLTKDGWIVVESQATRDQVRNLEDAREKLRALILQALFVPKPRRATKPTRGSKLRRLEEKRRTGDKKRSRSDAGDP